MVSVISRRVAVSVLFLVASCLLSALISRRLSSWSHFRTSSLIQALAVAVLVSSFLHISASSTLLFPLGTGLNEEACQAASVVGISTYLITKLFIFAFLLERVFLVWHFGVSRRKSLTYRLAVAPALVLLGVFGYVLATRHHSLRMPADNIAGARYATVCHLGLDKLAAALLLGTSTAYSCILLVLFLIPLSRAQFHRARTIARKSVITTVAALCSEAIILGILLGHDGWERAFGWLSSCGADVLLNAIIIYSVTSSTPQTSSFDVEAATPDPDGAVPRSPMCQLGRSPYGSTRSMSRYPTASSLLKRPSMSRGHSLDHLGLQNITPPSIALALDQPLRPRPDHGLMLDLRYDEEDDNSPDSVEYIRHSYLSTSSSAESSPSRPSEKSEQ